MTAALAQEPEALALATEAEQLREVLAQLQSSTITTNEQAEELNELVKEVKRDLKQLETDCQATTRSTFERLESMRDWFRPKRTALKELERVGKLKLAEYAVRLREAQTRAQQAAGQAFAHGDVDAGHRALAAIPEAATLQGTSLAPDWQIEVIAPDLVPYQFLSPDLAKIEAYVRQTNGASAVPGVRITPTMRVSTRA
jgi:hypothetical protein